MKYFLFIFILLSASCANFINKIHRDLDRADNKKSKRVRRKKPTRDVFSRFRNPYYSSKRNSVRNNSLPKVQRNYKSIKKTKRRYTADDLTDNQSDGSLWSGRGNNNYLFSLDQERKSGDIIVINVFDRLKHEIRMELKRSNFSSNPISKKKIKRSNQSGPKDGEKPAVANKPKEEKKETNSDEAFDKISSVIIEKINKEHFLIRGQKQILFKNKKRIVEIQALIAKRDIDENDAIHSDKILESNIYLVR